MDFPDVTPAPLLKTIIPTVTRRLQFCTGHRVMGHENKCAHLHGHNYVAFFTARARALDSIGRVIDFSVLKYRIKTWIDNNWDHGFVLFTEDETAIEAIRTLSGQKLYRLPANPTAENMAWYLLTHVCPIVLSNTDVEVFHVRIWETENCYADASLPE